MKMNFDEPNKAIITYTGFKKQHKLIAPTIIGYYEKVLEVSGAENINITYLTSIEENKDFCKLEIKWIVK